MDKTILARRKVQNMARDGHLQKAISELEALLGGTEADPYDHVYLGDLQLRAGRTDQALAAWETAMRSYERVGLYRNAIAICKKILRLDNGRARVHRTLGDLFLQEGLTAEAVPEYLAFLDSFEGSAGISEEFEEALERAASIVGLQIETALRLSDHFLRARKYHRAAVLLDKIADQVAEQGSAEMADEIRERARRAEAAFLAAQAVEGCTLTGDGRADGAGPVGGDRSGIAAPGEALLPGPAAAVAGPIEPVTPVEIGGPAAAIPAPATAAVREVEVTAAAETSPAQSEHRSNAMEPSAFGPDPHVSHETVDRASLPAPGPEIEHFRAGSGREAGFEEQPDVAGTDPAETDPAGVDPTGADPIDPADAGLREDADLEPIERAQAALAAGDAESARDVYEQVLRTRPTDREVIEPLIRICAVLGDTAGEVRYRILLGDSWIEDGDFAQAAACFGQLLRIDPDNATARRRMARFRDMGIDLGEMPAEQGGTAPSGEVRPDGAPAAQSEAPDARPEPAADAQPESAAGPEPDATERPHAAADPSVPPAPARDFGIPGVLETGGVTVSIAKAQSDLPGDEWVDLGALLDEFKAGVKNQIDEEDFQSHYDLALSHRAMGLQQEALEELEVVLCCAGLPQEIATRARELRGDCLLQLDRCREAADEFRAAVSMAGANRGRRWNALYRLGAALERAGEWREAGEIFETILRETPDFLDTGDRLRTCRNHGPDSEDGPSTLAA